MTLRQFRTRGEALRALGIEGFVKAALADSDAPPFDERERQRLELTPRAPIPKRSPAQHSFHGPAQSRGPESSARRGGEEPGDGSPQLMR